MHVEARHNQILAINPVTQAFRGQFIAHKEQVHSILNNRRRLCVASRKAKDFFGHTNFIKKLVPFGDVMLLYACELLGHIVMNKFTELELGFVADRTGISVNY
jgi:hypothetical protein